MTPLNAAEVCESLWISDDQLRQLIKDGKVGYYRGKRGARMFTAENVAEIQEALAVRPKAHVTDLTVPGQTARSAARRRTA